MAPLMVGAGSVTGKVSDKLWLPVETVARGAEPPPDRVRAAGTAAGDKVPSVFFVRVVSTGIQLPSRLVRTGCRFVVHVNEPSGFAVVCDASDVSASMITGCSDDFADSEAVIRGSVETDGRIEALAEAVVLADAAVGVKASAGIARPSTVASDVCARLPRVDREDA